MKKDIIEKITGEFSGLTKSGRSLANYILQNKNSVQFLSISALADASGVSEASITRFCRSLGLEGYNDLKLSLAIASSAVPTQKTLRQEKSSSENLYEEIGDRLLGSNCQALDNTRLLMNGKDIRKAVRLLNSADHVYCLGQGGSNITAMEARGLFSTVTNKFIHISDSHFQAMAASLATEKDVLLIFSYSAATRELQDLIKISRTSGVKIILVTRYPQTGAAKHADVVLLCGANESPLQSGSAEAKMSQLYIIEYLYEFYCMCDKDSARSSREKTAHVTAAKLL